MTQSGQRDPRAPPYELSAERELDLEQDEGYQSLNSKLARLALDKFNEDQSGKEEYELVKPVLYETHQIPQILGLFFHINFEAKRTDDPLAEVQLNFAELKLGRPFTYEVFACKSLGATTSESAAMGPNGCEYCEDIHHPKDYEDVRLKALE